MLDEHTLERHLRGAVAAARAIAKLHQSGIIHQHIRPDTLRISPSGDDVELSFVGAGRSSGVDPASLALESLPYVAPEQTGRFDATIDHRIDLYSLGIVLYERFAGELPFHASDAPGWVHCHVACAPRPLSEAAPGTPTVVSDIVMKLCAKSPDERYQSARGLALDLERCLSAFVAVRRVDPFPLGTRDVWDKLRAANRVYGRAEELAALREAVARAPSSRCTEVVLVTGPSGIGKSALVGELQRTILEGAFFLRGKFEQHKRDIPYGTLGRAFGDRVRQLLALPDAELEVVRQRLDAALGVNVRLVVELVPELELVLGKQDAVSLPASEVQGRLHVAFSRLLNVLCVEERPLVLVLDDMQWADLGSLDILEHVLSQQAPRNMLVIGVYRDEEVDASHPLAAFVAALRNAGAPVTSVPLGPLPCVHLVDLVVDLFGCERSAAEALATVLWTKTSGNPFFATQLLGVLHEERLIQFDAERWAFRWDIAAIEAKEITEDLVELVLAKLRRMPDQTRAVLQIAACTGIEISVDLLTKFWGTTPDAIRADLEPALASGIILQRPGGYRFLHDRLVHAAYSLIPESERTSTHLRLGWGMLEHTREADLEGVIFDVVNQLNLGAAEVESPDERRRIAELDLRAGRKAKAAAAVRAAASYLTTGISLLPWDGWGADYTLAYGLHLELAECEFLGGRFEEVERLCTLLIKHARTRVDRAAAYRLQILRATAQLDNARAVEIGRACLSMLGIELPAYPSAEDIRAEVSWVRTRLGGRSIESLRDLPRMSDPDTIAALDVLSAMFAAAVYAQPPLADVASGRIVRLSILHGNAPASVHGYTALGQLLCAQLGEQHDGYHFTKLGCELAELPGFGAYAGEALLGLGAMVLIWSRPMREALEVLGRGFRRARDAGKVIYAASCIVQSAMIQLALGDSLDAVEEAAVSAFEFASGARFEFFADTALILRRVVFVLRGDTVSVDSMNGDGFDEATFEEHLLARSIPLVQSFYYIYKLMVRLFAGDHAGALQAADEAERYVNRVRPYNVTDAELFFHAALAAAASYETAGEAERAGLRERLDAYEKQLAAWAESAPQNFACRRALVAAEIARVEGRGHEAATLYDEAIRASREGRFVQVEALASELAGRFYLHRGFAVVPGAYLAEARACYARWGAHGKVRQLDALHPELAARPRRESVPVTSEGSEPIDAITAAKASAAISSESSPSERLATLMRIMAEHAGAQRVCLLLPTTEGLDMAAEVVAEPSGMRVHVARDRHVTFATDFPLAVANYARRTREKLVLDDVAAEVMFPVDPYVTSTKPKSVLCVPIVRRGEVAGILYLENQLTRGAFTPRRMALLDFLAAFALENARLANELVAETAPHEETEAKGPEVEGSSDEVDARKETEAIVDGLLRSVAEQRAALRSRATPILELEGGILVVAVRGGVDALEGDSLTSALVDAVMRTGARFVILDLTGEYGIDARATHAFARIFGALELLGARGVVAGVPPELSRAVAAAMGSDVPAILVGATLREALLACQEERSSGTRRGG